MKAIGTRLAKVEQRIRDAERRFHREPGSVALLAVSKTQPPEAVETAYRAGQRAFGENYLQDALPKIEALAERSLSWHFIGALQSNKTKVVAENFDWVHTLERMKIARRLSEQRPPALGPLDCCIEVNVSAAANKSGLRVDEASGFAHAVAELPGLRLRGLMTIPEPSEDFEAQRGPLRVLRELFETLRAEGLALDTLSMGMSDDLEAAIAEGATVVRVGTAVFGAHRPKKEPTSSTPTEDYHE